MLVALQALACLEPTISTEQEETCTCAVSGAAACRQSKGCVPVCQACSREHGWQ